MLLALFAWQLFTLHATTPQLHCDNVQHEERLQFHLVRECQRATDPKYIALENTDTLEECIRLAKSVHGLALNYESLELKRTNNTYARELNATEYWLKKRIQSKKSIFEQPEEFFNCHVLECPVNGSFHDMVNDSRFDYYSLYGRPTLFDSYTCLPSIGLFYLRTEPLSFQNASNYCSNSSAFNGALAHVASEGRTSALAKYLREYNQLEKKRLNIAYVDLHFNRSLALGNDYRTSFNESLKCFLFRAWDASYPRLGSEFINESCVVLASVASWQNIQCSRKFPFFCEIFTPPTNSNQVDISSNAAHNCKRVT